MLCFSGSPQVKEDPTTPIFGDPLDPLSESPDPGADRQSVEDITLSDGIWIHRNHSNYRNRLVGHRHKATIELDSMTEV